MEGKPFQKGQSGNPGGRPKSAELRAVCREHTPKAVETLVALMDDKSPMIRLKASAEILDRAYGKAPQSVDIAMQDAQEATLEAKRPLTPHEVASALGELVAAAEKEIGLSALMGASTQERIKRVLEHPKGVPPALYAALHRSNTIQ
jgi:hypothetical protein